MTVLKTALVSVFVVATATSAYAIDVTAPQDITSQMTAANVEKDMRQTSGALTLAEALKQTGSFASLLDATAERSSLLFDVQPYRQAKLGS